MGQEGSKQQQIQDSIKRIRRDLRNGKIQPNEVEEIQQYLRKYEVESALYPNSRRNNGYTIKELIEITSKELDALKQEVRLDQAAVSTDSFKRINSKRRSIKSITGSVQDIRKEIRTKSLQEQDFDKLQRNLAQFSQELSYKPKKTENEAAQKLISEVTQELLMKQQNSLKSEQRKQNNDTVSVSKKFSSIDDIESKIQNIKADFLVAEQNQDKNCLRFLLKSIQTLMTDLQMTKDDQKKSILEPQLTQLYQQIDKAKKQLTEENDIKFLTDLQEKEAKRKVLQNLEEIQNNFLTLGRVIDNSNFQAEKKTFLKYKDQLESITDTSPEIVEKKTEITTIMSNVESVFTKIEMSERLSQAEWRHCQYKIDIEHFLGTTLSANYKKHRQYLIELIEYVNKVMEVNTKIDEKKKYLIYNIQNNIIALDQKANANEKGEKQNSRQSTTEDILVNIMNSSTRVQDLGTKLSTTDDIDSIRNGLVNEQQHLKQLPSKRNTLNKSRDEILGQIENLLHKLDEDTKNEKVFQENFNKLKEKVARFNGTYKNVLYNSIESGLNELLNQVGTTIKNKQISSKLQQELENTKLILEQKAVRVQQFENSKELITIRENVAKVRQALDKTLTKEILEDLDAKLTSSILALDNNTVDNVDEKQIIYNDIRLCFEKLQQFTQETEPEFIITKIQMNLDRIKPQILSFVGSETDPTFLPLDKVLVESTLQLDALKLDKTSGLYQAKMKLMQMIHDLSDLLDDRINQTEAIEQLEQDVRTVLIKIDSFNGHYGDLDYSHLDEEIIRLKINLSKFPNCPELDSRKLAAIKEVDGCMRKLNQAAHTLPGTLV